MSIRRSTGTVLTLLALLAATAGCDRPTADDGPPETGAQTGTGTGPGTGTTQGELVGSVTMTGSPAPLGVGESRQLGVEVRDTAGNLLANYPVQWASSDTTLAVVTQTGLVTARGRGMVNITVAAGSRKAGGTLQVYQARVSFSPDSLVFAGPTASFQWLYAGTWDGDNPLLGQSATFVVQDTTVVRMEGCEGACSGSTRGTTVKVTPLKAGTTRIIATWRGAADTAMVRVAP